MVMFGTSDTSNALADRIQGKDYQNVSTVRALSKVNLEFFRDLETFTAEDDQAKKGDLLDGLIVAIDMLNSFCGTKKYKKRIFLITDGERETKYNSSEINSLIQTIQERDIRLNVITLDFANEMAEDSESDDEVKPSIKTKSTETKNQVANKAILKQITDQTKSALFPAKIAMEIYQRFQKKEIMARTKYKGELAISEDLKLGVSVFCRTKEEAFPALKKYSKVAAQSDLLDTGKVTLKRDYTEMDDTDQKVIPLDQ